MDKFIKIGEITLEMSDDAKKIVETLIQQGFSVCLDKNYGQYDSYVIMRRYQ